MFGKSKPSTIQNYKTFLKNKKRAVDANRLPVVVVARRNTHAPVAVNILQTPSLFEDSP